MPNVLCGCFPSRLAVFALRVKKEGVFANAQDIPDHLANAFLVAKDSRFGMNDQNSIVATLHY